MLPLPAERPPVVVTTSSVPQPRHFWSDLYEAKELARLLTLMDEPLRLKWLMLCCMKVSRHLHDEEGNGVEIRVTAVPVDVRGYLRDFWTINNQFELSYAWATGLAEWLLKKKRLEQEVREFLRG